MKKGDTFPVRLNEYEIAEAVVVEIDGDEAILEVPATRIVMGIKTALGDLERAPEKDRLETKLPDSSGDLSSPATDAARAALEAEGIEIDDDDYTSPSGVSEDGSVSLKDMRLDGDV